MYSIKNTEGFSLIEALIAIAILASISIGVSDLIVTQNKSINFLQDKLEKIQIDQNIKMILNNKLACKNSLSGFKIPSLGKEINLNNLKDANGTVIYTSNSKVGNLNIGQIIIKNNTTNTSSSGYINIKIPISRLRTGGGPEDFKPYNAKLWISIDAGNNILSCSGPSKTIDVTTCRHVNSKSATNHDKVFYNPQPSKTMICNPDEVVNEVVFAPGKTIDSNDISVVCCKRP